MILITGFTQCGVSPNLIITNLSHFPRITFAPTLLVSRTGVTRETFEENVGTAENNSSGIEKRGASVLTNKEMANTIAVTI